jgi:hypothetical protein
MRLALFLKFMLISLGTSLLSFSLLSAGFIETLRMFALGTVLSIAVAAFYPEWRGVRQGDAVAVVSDASVPAIIGRAGRAASDGRKNGQIRITLPNGTEAVGVIESYTGLISPPKIRMIYEERPVD